MYFPQLLAPFPNKAEKKKYQEKEREYTHTKEEYVVSTNMNLWQTALRDQVESSFLQDGL